MMKKSNLPSPTLEEIATVEHIDSINNYTDLKNYMSVTKMSIPLFNYAEQLLKKLKYKKIVEKRKERTKYDIERDRLMRQWKAKGGKVTDLDKVFGTKL